MKLINKNQKNKIITLGMVLMCFASLGVLMHSCSQDDDFFYNIDNTKYLDVDVTNTTAAFTKTEISTIADAAQRIAEHMVFDIDSNKYVFQLDSPSEIKISERLFNYIYPSINLNTKNTTSVPRLKTDGECFTTSGYGYTQTTCNMTDQEIIKYFQTMISTYGSMSNWSSVASLIAAAVGNGAVSGALGIFALGMSLQGGTIQQSYNSYINSSSRTGGTVIQTNTFSSTATCYVSSTTYQFNFNK